MPIYFLMSIRVLLSVEFCFTLKISLKGAPFYSAWESRGFCDFQGGWEGRKTCFWFSSLSTARLFPQPVGGRVFVVKEIIDGHFASADSKPASRFFLAFSM